MNSTYTTVDSEYGGFCIIKTNDDETLTIFLEDLANSDYQQYLLWLEEQA